MKNQKKSSERSLLTASIIAGALTSLTSISANANTLFNYASLGTGAEIRSELLNSSHSNSKVIELECGNKSNEKSNANSKTGEAKCGDKNKKKSSTGNTSQKGKTTEGKCGEGKCGGGHKK